MSKDIEEQVLQQFRGSPLFALQLDESTDLSGQAQLLVFIRIVAYEDIVENFLCCKTLLETTKGEDIFETVDYYLKFANLPWDKCIGVCTDGASAMTGSLKGFISFAKNKNENIIFLHREALVTKTLVGDLREVMDKVVKVINYIKSSSLKSRLLEKICEGMDSDYSQLLFHSAMRWLSRGRVLSRFYDLSEEIIVFSTIEESKYKFLGDEKWWTKVSFLTDIFEHLNKLNTSMQGRKENILTSTDKMMAFNEDILGGKLILTKKN